MASLNKVMLIGNLTRDPEVRFTATGKAMATFGMAVNRTWLDHDGRKHEEASFFNLVAYEKRAEVIGKYCKKGNRLFVEGRLEARTVTNEKGETRTFHNIVVNEFQFLTPKGSSEPSVPSEPEAGSAGDEE